MAERLQPALSWPALLVLTRSKQLGGAERSHWQSCAWLRQCCQVQALQHRADTKLYRILSPQTPIARTRLYDRHAMDEFPNGTNMMVAVIAYTCAPMAQAPMLVRGPWHMQHACAMGCSVQAGGGVAASVHPCSMAGSTLTLLTGSAFIAAQPALNP